MCGIFAYLNFFTPKKRSEVIEILLQGLRRMEYRGYDSAGMAIDSSNDCSNPHAKVGVFRKAGKVDKLDEYIHSCTEEIDMDISYNIHCGIAHTRWATHGSPNDVNSHPQRSSKDNDFVVVHNGIITNYNDIKGYLVKKGYSFESETDTEAIAKLIQHIHDRYPEFSFRKLVETTIQQLEGAFALAFKSKRFPGQLVATRRGSPLLIGIKSESRLTTDHFPVYFSKARRLLSSTTDDGFLADKSSPGCDVYSPHVRSIISDPSQKGQRELTRSVVRPFDSKNWEVEYFVASDASAIVEHTRQVLYLEDDDVAFVEDGALSIHRIKRDGPDPSQQTRDVQQLTMELQQIMRGDFKTFMQKEIFEQPESVINTMRGRVLADGRVVIGGIKDYVADIKRCRRLIMIACGSSYNSAIACRQLMEELTELPVILELASDFLDRETPIFRDDVCFFISQSGETADTLKALRYCKPKGALLIGITNTVGSSICRESHCGIHINAGPEIGVASTKAYTSQIVSLVMFALALSDDRISLRERRVNIINELKMLSEYIKEVLQLNEEVLEISKQIYKEKSLLVMGRGYNFATCLEGALKIKELSYIHCEGILSGELKHGPLAMVDENLCIIMIICKDLVYKKSLNALQQVLARGGKPIIIADSTVPAIDLPGVKHILRVPDTVDCLQNILTVIPLQLLSYYIAELNGQNVDLPRNLAKSVTVE
uniref:glutamine--fructose-6-phosphate transaminase (isomerizing) n=1 Tax=Ditylenchus dipsaci TaxID=166011 RepID=A0A915E9R2_9BILA